MRSTRMNMVSGYTSTLGLVVMYALPTTGHSAASADASTQIDEIIVTARKVKERLQDVPISVSAITAENIAVHGLTDLADVARFSPGVNFENQFGRRDTAFNTSIRGVSSVSNAALSFKPFANFVDSVYVRGSLESFDLSDVERVEILRGPQAALYGRATESGAINYITRKPGDTLEGAASASVGGFGYQRYSGRLSGPIVADVLSFNVNGSYYQRDGEYLNLFSGRKDDSQKTTAGSASLRYTPGSAFDATLRVGYSRDEDGPPAIGYNDGTQNNCYLAVYPYYCGTIRSSGHVNLDDSTPVYRGFTNSITRASLNLNYHFGGFTLSSLTGWDSNHQKVGEDQSYDALVLGPGSGLPPHVFIDSFNQDGRSISEEVRLTSPRDEPLRYMLGAYSYYENVATADVQADFDYLLYGQLNHYTSSVHNTAVFGQLEYDFNSQWSLSGEIRAQRDDIRYDQPPANYFKFAVYDAANPRAVLNFKATPQVLVYASIGKGTKPGGFNSPFTPQDSFSEEKLWAYELGVKSEWLDRRLLLNAAFYYNRITDLQVTSAVPLPSGTINSYNLNAGRAHTQGIEIETQAKLSRIFSLRGTLSLNDSKFDDFQGFQDLCNLAGQYTADFVTFQGPKTDAACLAGPTGNARGKTLPNAPKTLASLQADLTVPTALGIRAFLRPEYSYKSKSYDEAENLADTGSQGILDLRLGVETDRWSITAWGKNLTGSDNVNYILRYIDFSPAAFNLQFFGPNRSFAYALPDRRQFGIDGRIRF